MADDPLIYNKDQEAFGSPVIDLASVRIRMGQRDPRAARACDHHQIIYSQSERRIWCEDCERTIDSFDAFKIVAKNFHDMVLAANGKLQRAAEAEAAVLVRRAAKELDRTWGHKMAACCPHCQGGLLPEDFAGGGGARSRELEIARRKRTRDPNKGVPSR